MCDDLAGIWSGLSPACLKCFHKPPAYTGLESIFSASGRTTVVRQKLNSTDSKHLAEQRL